MWWAMVPGLLHILSGRNAVAAPSGELLSGAEARVKVWWAPSSATKIRPGSPAPAQTGNAVQIECARNEWEAAQLVVQTLEPLTEFRLSSGRFTSPAGAGMPGDRLEFLQVKYLNLTLPSDRRSTPGWWPDPLLPIRGPLKLGAGSNHIFWLRVFVPKLTRAGIYETTVRLDAKGFSASVPLRLRVHDFGLPDRMSCVTAFGFSADEVFRYHGLATPEQKRLVLDKYLANLAAHHVSPYDPAPLDHFQVTWPDVRPPRSAWADWQGLRIVTNEVHGGKGSLLVNDDQPAQNVTVSYEPLIAIPAKGLRFRGWYRTAVPGHRFNLAVNHYTAAREWMSGQNRDLAIGGNGLWQSLDEVFTNFPSGAAFVRLHLRATPWTDQGEHLGLVWYDDLSLIDLGSGRELLAGGDFERKPRTELVVPREQLRVQLSFTDWDRQMERAMNHYHFNSFQVGFPGLGGGTFHAIEGPNLLGFGEEEPEYDLLMASYGQQLETHLREKGWLDKAFIYWFDEPDPDQYGFVVNGFAKLKRYAPGIARMLTEQVEPGLVGGPNLWCPISYEYNHGRAEERRRHEENFWWYICTAPKAPYAGLFIDHPAPEMRIWVWQTWQRGINGLLVWQLNYWTSSAAYPEHGRPQDPYADPMSWTSGYSTPAGQRLPWGNGDGRFLYPPPAAAAGRPAAPVLDGPVDSIRWEQLRDGIEDYEYLCMLRRYLEGARGRISDEEAQNLARLLDVPEAITRSVTEFTQDGAPIEAHRRAVARAIEKLGAGKE